MVRYFFLHQYYDERSCFILFLIMIQLLMKKDSTIHTISEIRKFYYLDFFFHSSFRTTLDLKIRKKGLRNRKPHKDLLILPLPTTFSSLQMSNE